MHELGNAIADSGCKVKASQFDDPTHEPDRLRK